MKSYILLKRGLRKKYVEHIVDFCIDHLKIRNSHYDLVVLPIIEKSTDSGLVVHSEKHISILLNPKLLEPYELAHTVAHEMIHVKQIARGLLCHKHPYIWWRGKRMREKSIPYIDRPWEKQAFREQSLLVALFERKFTSSKICDKIKS